MTNATDGAAEAARFLKPGTSADEQVVKKVRSSLKNQRDCGAASAVGAATVAISLLIGSGNVALDAFYVLLAGQVMLVYAAQYFTSRAALSLDRTCRNSGRRLLDHDYRHHRGGYFLVSELKRHESNVGSTSWWLLLGVAGVGGVLGLIIRRSAESLLDELDDESWRQRVAPLVDKQQEAIANMWAFEIRLRSVLENEPQGQSSS